MANDQRHRLFLSPVLLLLFLAASACAGRLPAVDLAREAALHPVQATEAEAERVFATVEAAVLDAFAAAEAESGSADRDRLRLGTIRRVTGGFSWTAPVRSRATVAAMAPLQIRFRLGPDDVAVYVVHPRSGDSTLDRLNEVVGRGERKLVDERDPLHRPLYVRTPSRRTLRYPEDAAAEAILEVVRRD